MKALKRYKYHLLALLILTALLMVGARTKMSQLTRSAEDLPHVGTNVQLTHALELFPSEKAGLAMAAQDGLHMRQFILNLVKSSLKGEQKQYAWEIAHSVIAEANHHKMDPLFLLAVIKTESKFNMNAHGSHGEIGLMQVLPQTAKWLKIEAGLPATADLHEPSVNIRLGATYLAYLRHKFQQRGPIYLAAYNMGSSKVKHLLARKIQPHLYASRVIGSYEEIYSTINHSGRPIAKIVAGRTPAGH